MAEVNYTPRGAPLAVRLLMRSRATDSGCLLWTGTRDKRGHGRLKVGGRNALAHILSYQEYVGPVPDGKELDHTCRNHGCIRPEHLEPVTHRVNCQRGEVGQASGARERAKTRCKHGHEYTTTNTYVTSKGHRKCRECDRLAHR